MTKRTAFVTHDLIDWSSIKHCLRITYALRLIREHLLLMLRMRFDIELTIIPEWSINVRNCVLIKLIVLGMLTMLVVEHLLLLLMMMMHVLMHGNLL